MKYIIVKHAGETWTFYFTEDPKKGPIHISHSALFTHSGKNICQLFYEENEFELANNHTKQLNIKNPVGDYAVCVLDEESLEREKNRLDAFHPKSD